MHKSFSSCNEKNPSIFLTFLCSMECCAMLFAIFKFVSCCEMINDTRSMYRDLQMVIYARQLQLQPPNALSARSKIMKKLCCAFVVCVPNANLVRIISIFLQENVQPAFEQINCLLKGTILIL